MLARRKYKGQDTTIAKELWKYGNCDCKIILNEVKMQHLIYKKFHSSFHMQTFINLISFFLFFLFFFLGGGGG